MERKKKKEHKEVHQSGWELWSSGSLRSKHW